MDVVGRFAGSSNATLLVTCTLDDQVVPGVYKPTKGERHLWDFPPGLHRREMAAFLLSEWLGWDLVPLTVLRDSAAPFGPGSVQLMVNDQGEEHYFTLREEPRHRATLLKMAAFDVVANNADRKSGHVILADDRLWAIDHGLCFHEDEKLRTVIWDFAGTELDEATTDDLLRLAREPVPPRLARLLDPEEARALRARAGRLADDGVLPQPDEDGGWPPYPWPLV
jgi:uncharacterized repeat protein (TIGR03843 family)